jgi:putative PIN family toxin of toxin-antitoxin system
MTGVADFEIVMCPALLAEVREVLLVRPRLRKWISLEAAELFVSTIETLIDLVAGPSGIRTETRDPTDDYIIALARENGAVLIVSGDKDLLEWEKQDPPVMTPSQFEEHLGII